MRRTPWVASILLVALSAVAHAAEVYVDHDTRADFSKYSTYTIQVAPGPGSELAKGRIVAAVERELAARGLSQVEGSGDLLVGIQTAVGQDIQVYDWGYGWGPRWRWGWGTSTIQVEKVLTGTLVVDLVEVAAKKLVFRGMATDTVSSTPEKNEKKINRAVARIFKKYPAGR